MRVSRAPSRASAYIHPPEPLAHDALNLERQDTDEDMGFNPPIHPVMHRPDVKRALESAETAFDILQFLVLSYYLLGVHRAVCGFENKFPVDLVFPLARLFIRLEGVQDQRSWNGRARNVTRNVKVRDKM